MKKVFLFSATIMLFFSSYQIAQAVSVNLNESIKHDTSSLPRQGKMHKSQKEIISNEPIRPDEKKKGHKKKKILVAKTKKKPAGAIVYTKAKVVNNVTVTAYCKVAKGKGKKIRKRRKMNGTGITNSGKKAKVGHIAADLDLYPIGTVFYIPGYGRGVVEDSGGGVKGRHHIDIFMDGYTEAMEWGKPKLKVWVQIAQK